MMSRKELNTYSYVRPDSNCPAGYKGCAFTSSLHRIFRRCSFKLDQDIQIDYTKKILASKGYGSRFLNKKLREFLRNRKFGKKAKNNDNDYSKRIMQKIPFDQVTKVHYFFKRICKPAADALGICGPSVVPKSKLIDFVHSKRKIQSKLRDMGMF